MRKKLISKFRNYSSVWSSGEFLSKHQFNIPDIQSNTKARSIKKVLSEAYLQK